VGDHEGHVYNEYMLISGMVIMRVVCTGVSAVYKCGIRSLHPHRTVKIKKS